MTVPSSDSRWKTADVETAPDPLSFKAFITEIKQGQRSAADEAARGEFAPEVAAMNLETTVELAAEETITLLKRVVTTARAGNIRVNPQRFCSKLSASLSSMLYNIGRIEGYRRGSGD